MQNDLDFFRCLVICRLSGVLGLVPTEIGAVFGFLVGTFERALGIREGFRGTVLLSTRVTRAVSATILIVVAVALGVGLRDGAADGSHGSTSGGTGGCTDAGAEGLGFGVFAGEVLVRVVHMSVVCSLITEMGW